MRDAALTTTLAHEFKRCKSAFAVYVMLFQKLQCGQHDENIKLGCYNAYADFVAHLYEFYLACIKSDPRYPANPTTEQIDKAMHIEATKFLNIRRERILRGDSPSWENHISSYEVIIPEAFGREFRKVRNLRSHVNRQRVDFDLGAFYVSFHGFLYIMYEECLWLWDTDDIDAPQQNWGQIEQFAKTVAPAAFIKEQTKHSYLTKLISRMRPYLRR